MPRLSLIMPVFNEAESIDAFFERFRAVRADVEKELGEGSSIEFLFVNDGSTDATRAILEERCEGDAEVKLVNFSRNFGKEAALSAGLNFASGDAAIPIDVDLQDPPEVIPEMIARWQEGNDVVYGVRANRQGGE